MTYRVIQWATGNVGRAAVQGVVAHPELELVGAYVHSADKHGRDVGELCDVGVALGVAATNDIDEVMQTDADCVVYTPLLGDARIVARLLRSGKNVVTPVGWFFPFATAGVSELEDACRAGGVTLHGTGIHPGGITEKLPLVVSALCRDIRHVRAEEWSDIRNYQAVAVVRDFMLFGAAPERARTSPMLAILGAGFEQSIRMIANALKIPIDDGLRATHEMAVATAPIDSPAGVLEAGTVAAQRFTWQATVDGVPVVTARVNWLMGEEHLDPPWRLDGERFEVELDAEPPVHLTFHGMHPEVPGTMLDRNPGLVATAMHCVNSVPAVCAAEPGIRTYLDLPLVAGRWAGPPGR